MTAPGHDEIEQLLGVYALDATGPEESRLVEGHLQSCPRCRSEVQAHREVAGMIGNSGGPSPEGLWERIAAELELSASPALRLGPATGDRPSEPRSSREAPAAGQPARGAGEDAVALRVLAGARTAGSTSRLEGASPQRRRPGRRAEIAGYVLGGVAAALALVVGLLSAQVSSLDGRVGSVQSALAARSVAEQALVASLQPGSEQVSLTAATHDVTPGGRLILVPAIKTAYFVSASMAALPGRRTYQLWALRDGHPVSVGLLGSDPMASKVSVQPGMATFMVTAEPAGGSPKPTLPVVVQGTLHASSTS